MAEVAAAARAAVPHPHLRARDGEAQETTAVELFFDLVYVLAVTQLSPLLLAHLSWASLGHTIFLLLVADRLKGESDSEHEQARDRRGAERGRTVASGVKAARSGGCTRSGSGQ